MVQDPGPWINAVQNLLHGSGPPGSMPTKICYMVQDPLDQCRLKPIKVLQSIKNMEKWWSIVIIEKIWLTSIGIDLLWLELRYVILIWSVHQMLPPVTAENESTYSASGPQTGATSFLAHSIDYMVAPGWLTYIAINLRIHLNFCPICCPLKYL